MNRVCMISQSGHNDPRVRRQAEALADVGYEVDINILLWIRVKIRLKSSVR